MPTDDAVHAQLEQDVRRFAMDLGYRQTTQTYHYVMDREIVQILQNTDTLSALTIRNNADDVFVHPIGSVFEAEYKARVTTDGDDGFFEVHQFALNVLRCMAGAKVLYCFRNTNLDLDVGFWCSDFSRHSVELIHWPARWQFAHDLKDVAQKVFPKAEIRRCANNSLVSSGDPYVVVPFEYLKSCDEWRSVITKEASTTAVEHGKQFEYISGASP